MPPGYGNPYLYESPPASVPLGPRYELAGFWNRVAARIIDIIIMGIILVPVYIVIFVYIVYNNLHPDFMGSNATFWPVFDWLTLLIMGLSLAIELIYYTLLEGGAKNATFGKRAVDIKVLDENYRPIDQSKAFVRNFGRFGFIPGISYIILLIDIILILATDRQQRIGDRMAHTIVVKERRYLIPYPPAYYPPHVSYYQPPYQQPPQQGYYQQPPPQPAPPYRPPPQEKEKE